jgi:Domain of unknown function (DUF4397)
MKKQLLVMVLGIAGIAIIPGACKKNDAGPQQDAKIVLVNAVARDSAAYDFYFDDLKLNGQAVKYPGNSGYLPLAPKNYTMKIAAANTINPVASGSFSFAGGRNYSVFAYDSVMNGKIKVFVTEDDLSAPAAGKAKVRFFHLSPVGITVDILANDSLLFGNRSYADNVADNAKNAFKTVDGGNYTIKVKLAGSPESIPALLTLNNVNLSAGKAYTLFAKGTVGAEGVDALGVELINNQ